MYKKNILLFHDLVQIQYLKDLLLELPIQLDVIANDDSKKKSKYQKIIYEILIYSLKL